MTDLRDKNDIIMLLLLSRGKIIMFPLAWEVFSRKVSPEQGVSDELYVLPLLTPALREHSD